MFKFEKTNKKTVDKTTIKKRESSPSYLSYLIYVHVHI